MCVATINFECLPNKHTLPSDITMGLLTNQTNAQNGWTVMLLKYQSYEPKNSHNIMHMHKKKKHHKCVFLVFNFATD